MPTMEFSSTISRSSSTVRSRSCEADSASTIACSAASRTWACSRKLRATLMRSASAKDSSTISSADPTSSALEVKAFDGSSPALCRNRVSAPTSSSAHAAR